MNARLRYKGKGQGKGQVQGQGQGQGLAGDGAEGGEDKGSGDDDELLAGLKDSNKYYGQIIGPAGRVSVWWNGGGAGGGQKGGQKGGWW